MTSKQKMAKRSVQAADCNWDPTMDSAASSSKTVPKKKLRLSLHRREEEDKDPTVDSAASSSKTVPKKKKLRLSLHRREEEDKENHDRWQVIDETRKAALSEKFVPKNTVTSTKWAVANFESWRSARNSKLVDQTDELVPSDLLESRDKLVLNKWLCVFVAETRKQDGNRYSPKSLYQLLTGILRHMRNVNPSCPNFLDTDDHSFSRFHNTLDNILRELRADGVGVPRQAEIFTKEDEESLWLSGVLTTETPKGLLRAVFFLNGKLFCLRGGAEHRDLKISQVVRHTSPLQYTYTENVSKNRVGGLKQLKVKNKVVQSLAVEAAGNRCHVYVIDLYLSKLPEEAFVRDNFYVQPLSAIPDDSEKPWFTANPIGRNSLSSMIKEVCLEGGISGRKTNHSLRATGASHMYQAGVPEKLIQETTGHLSTSGVRQYENTTIEQQRAVSRVLSCSTSTGTYEAELQSAQSETTPPVKQPSLPVLQPSSTGTYEAELQSAQSETTPPVKQPSLPVLQPSSAAMNFSGCTVTIYNAPPPSS